jgi:hypothetical protein
MKRTRHFCACFLSLIFSLAVARGQFSFSDQNSIGSVSGQFTVSVEGGAGPPAPGLIPGANTNVVQLKTALLAVAAERFKNDLWRELGLRTDAPWSGRIYLHLRPARSFDDPVTITSRRFLDHWNYDLDLPDTLQKTRYARALSGVLLLEFANRHTSPDGHAAEVPAWLVDGLARQILAADGDEVVLSAPKRMGQELGASHFNEATRGFDFLAPARHLLQNYPALTFDQLSWPTDQQMDGADGGVYLASAQLFLAELLDLKNGRENLRTFLAGLPGCYNWQTAFFAAFGADFKRPIDVEKWWALRVVNFARHATGPRWTIDVSLARLQELLSVPVEFRYQTNALPNYAEISLQSALQNLSANQLNPIVRTKVRDLALVELRLAPPFGSLADGYRAVLADFLGDVPRGRRPSVANKHGIPVPAHASLATTLKKLDALDVRRRNAEARVTLTLQNPPR